MPAQVRTQLLDDSPAVAVIGDNSLLRQGVERLLQEALFSVQTFSIDEFLADTSFSGREWYKIIWLNTSDLWAQKRYLEVCAALRLDSHPIVVIQPIFSTTEGSSAQNDNPWVVASQLQNQVIVDCSYYLPAAAFIFGRDIVLAPNENSSSVVLQSGFDFITKPFNEHQLLQVKGELFPQSLSQFIFSLSTVLFRPFSAVSIQIKGKRIEISDVIKQITSEYFSYYGIKLTSTPTALITVNPIPFSVKDIQSQSGAVVTDFVRSLPVLSPTLIKQKNLTSEKLPVPEQSERTQHARRNEIYKEHPPTPLLTEKQNNSELFQDSVGVKNLSSSAVPATTITPRVSALPSKFEKAEENNTETPPLEMISKEVNINNDHDSVQQDLQKIFQTSRSTKKTSHVKNLVQVHTKVSKKTKRKRVLFYSGIGVIGVGLGILFLAGTFLTTSYYLSQTLLSSVIQAAEGGEIPREKLKVLAEGVAFQVKSYSAVIQIPQLTQAAQQVELSERLIKYSDIHKVLVEDEQKLVEKIVAGAEFDVLAESESLATRSRQAYEEISYLQGLLESSEQNKSLNEQKQVVLQEKLESERRELLVAQQLLPLLPEMFAHSGSKTYAVLFQNDQELRPTGGFIQAVGFLEFAQGSLRAVSAQSSYELDKEVFGEVVPPPEITQYLGEQRLYLRDSNWNPDYPTSAEQARWFIEKATGDEIAGVIALNTHSLAAIIEAVGPIDLPEFNEVLTHKNLKERMEFHSEVVLVESSDIPDYSTLVLQRTLEKVKTLSNDRISQLTLSLSKSLKQQQLLLHSTSPGIQSNWQTLGWSGGIITPQCPSQFATTSCLVEAIAQVEANVGVNKANYYLEKEVSHSVAYSDIEIIHSRVMTYVNTAQSDAWPKGTYKTFVRLFLPEKSSDIEVSISGRPLAPEQITQRVENEKVVVGFYLEVPIQSSRVVTLSFKTERPQEKSFSHAIFDQKQSGTTNTPYSLTIDTGELQPALIAPQAEVLDGEIRFSQVQDSHLFFGVRY